MSVLLGDRKESKFEAITYSIELHDMLILLMQRGFGVKDVDSFVHALERDRAKAGKVVKVYVEQKKEIL